MKYFRIILLLLLKRDLVIIQQTSINPHILNKSNKKAVWISESEFSPNWAGSQVGQMVSQLLSGQSAKLGWIVKMPYVPTTWTVTGDSTVQSYGGKANED